MNLKITSHHVEITPAMRSHLEDKLARVLSHFDQVQTVSAILAINNEKEKDLRNHAEITIHLKGKDIFAEAHHADMYHAMELLRIKSSMSAFGIFREAMLKISSDKKAEFIEQTKTLKSNKIAMLAKAREYFIVSIELDEPWLEKIAYIEKEFEKAQYITGVTTHLGFNMKSGYEDATILRDVVSFLTGLGTSTMILKDVNGELHKDIPLADVTQISQEIAGNYLQLWNKRELLKEQVRSTINKEDLVNIVW